METKEWYKALSSYLCLIGLLIVIGIFYHLLTRETLSVSDSILLTFISVLISAGISLYLGRYYSYEEARKRIEGEATKALRRIICIKNSADRLRNNTDRIINVIILKYEKKEDQELLLEYFRGIHSQLLDLIGNIRYSIDDWADIVPKEVKEFKELEKKELEIYDEKLKEWDKITEQYADKLEKSKGKQLEHVRKEVEKQVQKLRSEYEREIVKMKAEASVSIPYSTMSSPVSAPILTLPSTSLDLGNFPLSFDTMRGIKGGVLNLKDLGSPETNKDSEKDK